ncbi:AAA family ATPase [Denitrobaculum tricleocarpae]|uniref:ATP-binding protein n=1 Tax=Denitrobaculum tricleocarpae TaxID=2591009 RepID=A0A545SST9_9PROT|nr:ATP-binding protein [Denitrobaculum tricleocarpae]TQV68029.1 ATP-binding protein [Denitrobaculum tricleocarpae]
MARGELMKKLLLNYGRDKEFRSIVEQIISEEEKKNNKVLARGLRKALDTIASTPEPKNLSRLVSFPDEANEFIQRVEPRYSPHDIQLSAENLSLFQGLIEEFRKSDLIKRHGLPVRSKLLFCGPPGTGKTLCAEIFAGQLGLPFFHVKLDRLISSFLGETATNIRKTFEFARRQPCILFFDEFDAIARSREEGSDHSELRRVVNSLLIFIDQIQPGGFLIAATNLDGQLDPALWRRFDEVVWFDHPDETMTRKYLTNALKNSKLDFEIEDMVQGTMDYSYAELEKICNQAKKLALLDRRKTISKRHFRDAIRYADRRRMRIRKLTSKP